MRKLNMRMVIIVGVIIGLLVPTPGFTQETRCLEEARRIRDYLSRASDWLANSPYDWDARYNVELGLAHAKICEIKCLGASSMLEPARVKARMAKSQSDLHWKWYGEFMENIGSLPHAD